MFDRTHVLQRRIKRLARLAVVGTGLLLVLFEIGVCSGYFADPGRAQLFPLAAAAAAAVFGVAWRVQISRPCRTQAEYDVVFINGAESGAEYQAAYVWSDSNGRVLEKYRVLTAHKELMKLSIENSRYLALQQQINPHFLYNTLDAIRSDMLIAGEERIADTVEALSKYFSYVVSNMERLATIDEELNNVRDYFHVQEYRFEDRIAMQFVDEIGLQNTENLVIPRLTLQPLVENAISHGLEKSMRHGTVTIRLTLTQKDLVIHVTDDGDGMSPEALEQLNQDLQVVLTDNGAERQPKKKGGIALRNVNRRIRLLFGEEYGLRIYSMQGAGTDLCVYLPKLSKEDLDEDRTFTHHRGQ